MKRFLGFQVPTFLFAAVALGGGFTALSCGNADIVCGPGTHASGNECVSNGGGGAGAAGGATGGTGGTVQGGGGTGGAAQGGGSTGGGVVDPGYPDYPEVIDHLTIAIRTGSGTFDGTNANGLSVCLTQAECFVLNVLDVDDFRKGEVDVYHFTGVGLSRTEVDRVEIRSENGTDAWRPDCVEIQFDGEPVYCEDTMDIVMGNGAGELASYMDPAGLHQQCSRCYQDYLSHGPLLGAVGDKSARLFLRTDATRKVEVQLVDEATPDKKEVVAYLYPTPAEDYATPFEISGLAPGHKYKVSFQVDGELSTRSAHFHTAPPPSKPAVFKAGYGSCSRFDDQPIFGIIQSLNPDMFVFGGDNDYGNTADLESLWWNYRWALDSPERASFVASTPSVATWDDHDFVGNNSDGQYPGKEQALRAFRSYWANDEYGTPTVPGVFSRYSYADVDFFLLDSRYYRSPKPTPGGSILGAEQTAWLKQELKTSTATFKLLFSGTIWSPTGDESWLDFPVARADVFDFIRDNNIGGVVLVAGDVHRSSLRKIHRAAAGGYDLPEIIGSPLANANSGCGASVEPDAAQLSCDDDGNFFAMLEFDTTASDPVLVARIIDEQGMERAAMTVKRSELKKWFEGSGERSDASFTDRGQRADEVNFNSGGCFRDACGSCNRGLRG